MSPRDRRVLAAAYAIQNLALFIALLAAIGATR